MPLVILHPDDNGDTALEIALKKQRPKCFELMIDMLEDYQEFFISKMMLNSFP
jgi:ankyrin repeat protein